MFKWLGDVLPSRVNRLKVRPVTDVGAVCAAVNRALDTIWNHAVPMRAVTYRAGQVKVAVISAAWGHEITSREGRIIELANARLRKQTVKQVRAVISPERAERTPD